MVRRWGRLGGASIALGASLVACGSTVPKEPSGADQAASLKPKKSSAKGRARAFTSPARLLPGAGWLTEQGPDRIIASGLRAERDASGAIQVASDLLPASRQPGAFELPDRLGGGYLFYTIGKESALWRASTWTAPLTPLSTVAFRARRVEAGFDRIYVLGRREIVSINPESGRGETLGVLPPAADYAEVRFGQEWTAAVEVPLAGVLATFDAGQSWWKVPGALRLLEEPNAILVATEEGVRSLEPDGHLAEPRATGDIEEEASEAAEEAEAEEEPAVVAGSTRKDVLRAAVLRGAWLNGNRAAVVTAGDLRIVSLKDGRVVAEQPDLVGDAVECQAIRVGFRAGFVCQDSESSTQVFTLDEGRAEPFARLSGSRAVLANGARGVVFAGACSSAPRRSVKAADSFAGACLVSADPPRDLKRAPGELLASTPKGVIGLTPPRVDAKGRVIGGSFRRVDVPGAPVALVLPEDEELRVLLSTGDWLAGLHEAEGGGLATWVASAERFVGVRVLENGRVQPGSVQRPVRRALISERFALLWGAAGFAKESTDTGQTWSETSLPYRTGDPEPNDVAASGGRVELGCSAVGCAVGPWLRVGWGADGDEPPLREAEEPSLARGPELGGGRWRLECRPTGKRSDPYDLGEGRRHLRRLGTAPSAGDSETFPPFWDRRAPTLQAGATGHALSSQGKLAQLYAWGPLDGPWGSRGRVQITWLDPFSVEPPQATVPTRAPWQDSRRAEAVFGVGARSGVPSGYAALDPSGDGGLFLLASQGQTLLAAFQKDRPLAFVAGADEVGLNSLSGAVQVGEAWYGVQVSGSNVLLVRVDAGQVEVFGEYPGMRGQSLAVRPVRSVRGDGLGLWVDGDRGWVVYPVDLATGDLGTPVVVSASDIASRPAACPSDAVGYVISAELSIAPYVEVKEVRHDVDLSRVTAEMVVGVGKPCLSRMSAVTRDLVVGVKPSSERTEQTIFLTAAEWRDRGRRWELACD